MGSVITVQPASIDDAEVAVIMAVESFLKVVQYGYLSNHIEYMNALYSLELSMHVLDAARHE